MAHRPVLTVAPRRVGRKADLTLLRREGKVPAVLYGHGDPETVALDAREVHDLFRRHGTSALVDLDAEGDRKTGMFKQVGRHPVSGHVVHLDIQRVALTDTITTHVPLILTGEEELIRDGLVVTRQLTEVTVSCRADHLPESFHLDLSGRGEGDIVRITELSIPEGVTLLNTADQVIVGITKSAATLEAEGEAAAAAEEAAAAEPGGAGEKETDETA